MKTPRFQIGLVWFVQASLGQSLCFEIVQYSVFVKLDTFVLFVLRGCKFLG